MGRCGLAYTSRVFFPSIEIVQKFQISALDALNINAAKRLVYRTQQQACLSESSVITLS